MTDVIKTPNLLLRPPVPADAPVLIAAFNDYEVVKWLARPPYPFTEADVRLQKPDGSSRWPETATIELDGVMIGMVGGDEHLGFWLMRSAWGHGYATEAAQAMAARMFERTGADHIVSGYFEGNQASARVLAKTGFREVGRGQEFCVPRKCHLAFVDMRLSRTAWESLR